MKIFKRKHKGVFERFDDLEIKIDDLKMAIKVLDNERTQRLEDMLVNMKANKITEYDKQIKNLKSQIESKDLVIDQQQKGIEKNNKKIIENDLQVKELNKQIKKLEKEIEKYKENGIVVPKKITPAVPRKGQAIRETIRPVKK